jgi:ADP-ribose pyrophosphatase
MPFDLIHSERVYQGRAFAIRRDQVRLPNGQSTQLDIVEHVGSAIIIPLDERGNVTLIRQYRHAAGDDLLELPTRTLNPDEDPLIGARREVREETGLDADLIREIGSFYLAPGYSTEFMHVYLATGLHPAPLERDEDEFLEVVQMPVTEVLRKARAGEISDAKTLAALLLAQAYLTGPES